ncbi:M20/M25/M40 family metallo-hydrolase [Deinococcus peraridilitoris]|uniref:Acetylornithine deacetylase/succinyldiaminopimelate desuccinylase-like deacylase n=1 Tax=Deinococcus peraridilitoris (strain DSM 19664 / LMG 22246 / CIP 109416 / KR-200) TaxID=937777 RepID=L0A5F2_DEIPD|nr:M20/M25/M40 family metallo-hydrolase [Deinococcus peraridilitoris]AFZ69086.1 acetylornithine deacetylase/succinyldiaminopimelate desuccinylase-like deacylase [Deinococcus peraridilitoris DSM 19664]
MFTSDLSETFERARRDLADLVKLQSVSAQGRQLPETADAVTVLLEAEGFTVKRYEGQVAPVLIAEAGQGARTVLLYNHYDVQPETPLELWDSPPFELTERAGRLYGRGASDDKGELISRLGALRALKASCDGELPFRVRWLIEGEEEIGSPSLARIVREHADELRADFCWWEFGTIDPAGRPVLYAGLKGILCLELRARVAQSDLHSQFGAVVDNPLYQLARALSSMRDEQGRVTIEGFHDDVRPASEADLGAVSRIPDESSALQETYGITGFLGNASGAEFYRRLALEPVLNINGVHGGYGDAGSKTVLPATAFAKLDFRLVPDQSPSRVAQLVREHLARIGLADVEVVELESHEEPARSDLTHPLVQLAVATARDVYGAEPVLHPSSGGSGPMHPFIEYLGMPVVAMGIGNLGGRVHAPNENIRLEDFQNGIRFGAEFFRRLAQY